MSDWTARATPVYFMRPFLRILSSRSVLPAIKLTGNSSTRLKCRFSQVRGIHEALALSDAQRRTIYALSTPPGKAGIAVVRISGPDALLVWKRMVKTHQNMQVTPKPWKLQRCHIIHPDKGAELLDEGLAVFFQGELTHHLCPDYINEYLVQHPSHLLQRM
jgi:tRNA modification GTPase